MEHRQRGDGNIQEQSGEVAFSPKEKILIIEGDLNAQVGIGSQHEGMCGRFGLNTRTNDVGRNLVQSRAEDGLCYANSFVSHPNRGTWFSSI